MKLYTSLFILLLLGLSGFSQKKKAAKQPNILLITVDDMNWNSVGAFGAPIKDITPNIDALAEEGISFERAYVTAANCSPSRVSIQTGLFPQQSGARGFYYINDKKIESLGTILKKEGYFTGVLNKSADSNPSPNKQKYWDNVAGFKKGDKYASRVYQSKSQAFFSKAKQSGKPFYFLVNIADPHKPFFNDQRSQKMGFDDNEPSRIIDKSEVAIPGFLPKIPGVRADVRNYYNSVRRADDCMGAVMNALKKNGLGKNTFVIFLSDHGMAFPFAKSCVYDNGLRTPLIIRWKGNHEEGKMIKDQLVSSVDILPTLMDLLNVEMPNNQAYQGLSFLNTLKTGEAENRKYVFGNFDENAAGYPSPMRGVISQKWNYVFNAWGTGDHNFKSATMGHKAFKSMKKAGEKKPAIQQRVDFLVKRTVEELYDLENDPNCLKNLAHEEGYAEVLAEMQEALRQHMVRTDDYLLEAFKVRDDKEKLNAFMESEMSNAKIRSDQLKWKRPQNLSGPAKENTLLYNIER